MKKLSPELQNHVAGECTTLCRCWIIETITGERTGFTDHDNDIVVDGVLCERSAGAEASGVEERIGLNVDASEIAGALQSDRISSEDIRAGKYDGGRITTCLVNWSDPQSYIIDQTMLIGEIHQEDGNFRFEMRGLSSLLEQSGGRHFIATCQADLGDGECQVNLESPANLGTGVVAAVLSPYSIRVTGLESFAPGWFDRGHLTWEEGANAGRAIEITSHELAAGEAVLGLWQPMPKTVAAGDGFRVTAGCDKRFATCKEKFANPHNFRGFPHMPGDRFALSTAGNTDQFDGEPIVP